jgi:hypothetical protein
MFVCVAEGAPEADLLVRFGLSEGPANTHPGQGTANRRFFFENSMLELLWVSDPAEAQSEATLPTALWDRWSRRLDPAVSPFGFVLRPQRASESHPPFPAREYRPRYLPDGLVMHIGDAPTSEPMWVFAGFLRAPETWRKGIEGKRQVTEVKIVSPADPQSATAAVIRSSGVIRFERGPDHLLDVEFDGGLAGRSVSFAPALRVAFRW